MLQDDIEVAGTKTFVIMENKICTTIEQSKKLIELGINTDTSDMVYLRSHFEEEGEYILLVGSYHEGYMEKDDGTLIPIFDEHIPAWSLVALLELMPDVINIDGINYRQQEFKTKNSYCYCYADERFPVSFHGQPIDAAFEMICWLKENNKI